MLFKIEHLFAGKMEEGNDSFQDNPSCKNPNCPKKDIEWNTILQHIIRAKKCRIYYSDAEVDAIRNKSKQIQNRKKKEKRKDNCADGKEPSSPVATTSGVKKVKIKKQCKICKKYFVSLLSHLNLSETCKSNYGEGYKNLKSEIDEERKMYKKNYDSQNKEAIIQSKAKRYNDNREALSQASLKYYNDNKEVINEKKRKRYSIHKKEINERIRKQKKESKLSKGT
jgi:hypothetical protein